MNDDDFEDPEELVISMAFQNEADAMNKGHFMDELAKTTLNILDDDEPCKIIVM